MITAYSRRDAPSLEVQTILEAYVEAPGAYLAEDAGGTVESLPGGELRLAGVEAPVKLRKHRGRQDAESTKGTTRIVSLWRSTVWIPPKDLDSAA